MNKIKKCTQCTTEADAVPTSKGGRIHMVCDNCGSGVGSFNNKGIGKLIADLRKERDLYRTAFEQISVENTRECRGDMIDNIICCVLAQVESVG